MLLCKVIVTIVFACLTNAQNTYNIPKPNIEVINPEHFRISIEDYPGVTFVAFHVNINEDLQHRQIGEFSKEVFHPVRGRWEFEVSKVHLHAGDRINYWLFVIQDRMGYSKLGTHYIRSLQDGSYEATDVQSTELPLKPSQPQPEVCETCVSLDSMIQEVFPTPVSSTPASVQDPTFNVCEHFLLNTTQNLLNLQSQLDNLRNLNQQLTNLLEYYPDSKNLTLSGKIPVNNDPVLTVKFIIREKLDLNPDIVSAEKISEGSIEFKVATIAEKLEILEVAKVKLVDSRFSIS